MGGVGGPLLCIDDLLSDVGEIDGQTVPGGPQNPPLNNAQSPRSDSHPKELFEENYDELCKALASADPSWTSLTLKLCTAVEAGNKLVDFGNSQVSSLSEKVEQLQRMTKQIDSAVAAAKAIQDSYPQPSIDSKDQ